MTKYHISPKTGAPGVCKASTKPCPIGGADEHYSSKQEAQRAYEAQQHAVPSPASKETDADRSFQALSHEDIKTYLSDEANEEEADEFLDKVYEGQTFSEDLEALGNKVSPDYRDNHVGGYEVVGFQVTHRGRTLHGVIYDDGYSGDTGEMMSRIDFADDEAGAKRLLQEEIENFVDRVR